ncbi:MAG: hypothetical protein KKA16_10100 [Alphaproteobacteria bacterium]|nr:hypothetical protein [Alphaproteobacteria bacterium]MBU2380675.1 hypothetical protein [Alphaproteobacteria bacterium]
MYSTLEGAKARAKELKRLLDDSSFHVPLNKCQAAVAVAGGYQDWHDLQANLRARSQPVDTDAYRRRLRAALPPACHGPLAEAWNPDPDAEEPPGEGIPPKFFRDAWPYVMAAEVLHRTRTDLIRPGSGKGQKLRQAMVCGVLLNIHGGLQSIPTLDPDTLALDYPGDLKSVFRDEAEHPRFTEELAALTEAGVIAVVEDRNRGALVRILAPVGLPDEIARRAVLDVEYAAQVNASESDDYTDRRLTRAIHEALLALGVDDTVRVSEAIRDQHASEYVTPSGAMLALLGDFARDGRIRALAHGYRLFSVIHRLNATFVAAQTPAMIGRYMAAHHGISDAIWSLWLQRNPDWSVRMRGALEDPLRFEGFISATAAALGEDETRAA